MNKQDRTYPRTAHDLEVKYNLGRKAQGSGGDNSAEISKLTQELSEHKTQSNNKINGIQAEIDIVTALANANKAAHEANSSAIKATQDEVERVSGRVTTLEDWHEDYIEVTSLDINGLFM